MKKLAAAMAIAIMVAAVPAVSANAAVSAPDAVTSQYGSALGSATSGKYVVSSGSSYIIVDSNGNFVGNYNSASPTPETVVERYHEIIDYTEDGHFVVDDGNGNLIIVDEHGNVLGAYRGKVTGRTSPKTGEFPITAALSVTAIVSAAGIALCSRKENE